MASDTFINIFPNGFTSVGSPGTIQIAAPQAVPGKPPAATKLLLKFTGNLGALPTLVAPSVGRGGLFTLPSLFWSVDAATSPLGTDTPVVNANGNFIIPNYQGFKIDPVSGNTYVFDTRSPIQFVSGCYSIGLDGSGIQDTNYTLVATEIRYQWGV